MTQHDTTRWNILIYGAGPMGSIIAARLHEAGHQVSVLARNERLAQLREHGVVIQEEGSSVLETARVKVVEVLNPDDEYDLVIVVMRRNQALQILNTLAATRDLRPPACRITAAWGYSCVYTWQAVCYYLSSWVLFKQLTKKQKV